MTGVKYIGMGCAQGKYCDCTEVGKLLRPGLKRESGAGKELFLKFLSILWSLARRASKDFVRRT
jgi:hypothetical protein